MDIMDLLQSSGIPTGLDALAEELTSHVPVTSVPSAMTVPYATITSVIDHVQSVQDSALSVLATATNSITSISLENKILQAQATLNYYSVLNDIATATTTATSDLAQAAEASAIMKKIFDDNAFYSGHYPSLGGNIALLVVYSLMLVAQIIFGVFFHQWWFLVCFASGLSLEVLGYIGRVWSSQNINNFNAFVLQLVCLTLAPCFLMAGIYYIIAQLTLVYGQKYSVLRPMVYSLVFIVGDVISIILQAVGGAIAAGSLSLFESTKQGSNIMVGGLAFQVFTIGVFQMFWYLFLFRVYKASKAYGDSEFNPNFVHIRKRKLHIIYLGTVSIAVLLVFVRSIYRLIELAEGWSSKLAVDEIYFMILEALMISLASFLMTVVHPGIAYGRNSHLYIDKGFKALFSRHHQTDQTVENDKLEDDGDVTYDDEKRYQENEQRFFESR